MTAPDPPDDESGARAIANFLEAKSTPCLILLRHGRTVWNAHGRLQGQRDSTMDSAGLGQARRFGILLADIPLSRIVSSDLNRCTRTARSVAERNLASPEVVPTPLLREMALGLLEGELKHTQSSDEATQCYRALCDDEINYRVPRGGESLRDVYARVETFFDRFRSAFAVDGNHLIVGHRNVNKMLIKYWLDLSFEEGFRVEHENQRIYFFFPTVEELWSCRVDDAVLTFREGYATGSEVYG